MAKYMMFAFTTPVEGRDAEYNNWYDNVAMPVYRDLPNTKVVGRFKAIQHKGYEFERDNDYGYVSVYEFETDNLDEHFKSVKDFIATTGAERGYHFSDDIDKDKFFEPLFIKM